MSRAAWKVKRRNKYGQTERISQKIPSRDIGRSGGLMLSGRDIQSGSAASWDVDINFSISVVA